MNRFREKVPAYASTAELGTPEDRAELARRYRDEGFQAMKLRFRRRCSSATSFPITG